MFDIIYLLPAELEEPKISVLGKGLKEVTDGKVIMAHMNKFVSERL